MPVRRFKPAGGVLAGGVRAVVAPGAPIDRHGGVAGGGTGKQRCVEGGARGSVRGLTGRAQQAAGRREADQQLEIRPLRQQVAQAVHRRLAGAGQIPLVDHRAVAHHHHAVGGAGDAVVVGDHDDGLARFVVGAQEIEHNVGALDVKIDQATLDEIDQIMSGAAGQVEATPA